MSIKRYLTIQSIDRDNGSPESFEIRLRQPITYKTCQLINANIPNTYFNVTEDNNTIYIDETLCTMPEGNYNLDEFFAEFVNLHPRISTINFDDTLGQLTIVCTQVTTIYFGTMYSILGFDKNYNDDLINHVSLYPVSLAKHILYIDISEISSNHVSSFINNTAVFAISNNVNKNEIIQYNERTNFKQMVNCRHNDNEIIHTLTIKLRDQYNRIIKGCGEWNLILAFY
jgi:hypothetical protein